MTTLLKWFFIFYLFATSALAAININTADIETLTELKGIGPVKGQMIIDYRTEYGNFDVIDDLTEVKGIGTKTLEKIRDKVEVNDTLKAKR